MEKRHHHLVSLGTVVLAATVLLGACGSSPGSSGTQAGNGPVSLGSTPMNPLGDAVEIKIVKSPYGPALGRGNGLVLYAWDKETDGSTICSDDACVEKWPPVTASTISFGDGVNRTMFSLVDRPDGTKQVAIQGRRLYTMRIDVPGEANCQGSDGWWILNPDGTKNTNAPVRENGTTTPSTTVFSATTTTAAPKGAPAPTPTTAKTATTRSAGY